MAKNKQISSTSWEDYELMDAGGGKKLPISEVACPLKNGIK
jgi:hypothetical protein